MFSRAIRLPDLVGVAVRLDLTWVLAAGLVGWSFIDRFGASTRTTGTAVTMGLLATLGFFVSILAHELGHAVQARARDVEVRGITLFLLGGVTEMSGDATSPRTEFVIAAIGPWISLVLAAVLGLVTAGLDEYVASAVDIASVTGNLAWINLGIAIFNLFPGAPLDGGRVLRALLWRLTGDRGRAMRIASVTGQLLAVALVGLAVLLVLRDRQGWFGGAWLVVIALFVWFAAVAERRHGVLLGRLEGRLAADGIPHGAPGSAEDLVLIAHDAPLLDLLRAVEEHDRVGITHDGGLVVIDRTAATAIIDDAPPPATAVVP